MDKRQSAEVENIFLKALDLSPDKRSAFVDQACGDDSAQRLEVLVLLEAAKKSDDYFDGLPKRLGIDRLRDAQPENTVSAEVGNLYGQYRLTRLLGTGGMGAVWCAERSDGRFEGQVAVKLLTRTESRAALARFNREAHYLAKLTHPSIARLLDAGVGTNEVPFLILDYVDGTPIDEHCDQSELGIEQRIRLFIDVLDAVADAHAQLIVHSDLKPSNVLVTGDGRVKLLDFGIAKLLTDNEKDGETGIALTPEFASPEQLSNGNITTATDIYSLGLLLYLLLAGTNARQLQGVDTLNKLREIAMREPPSLASTITDTGVPSLEALSRLARVRQATPGHFLKILRGDLDEVVRKALAVNPKDRYLTVADFASDLRRYLKTEPVSAQADTFNYRTKKFVQRHRGGVLTATLTVALLLSTTFIATWQGIEARRQRDNALAEQQRAQSTNSFMNLLLSDVGTDGRPFTVVELLDRGLAMLDLQQKRDVRFVASAYYDIAQHFINMGDVDRAREILDKAASIAQEQGDEDFLARSLCSMAKASRRTDPDGMRAKLQEANLILAGHRDVPILTAVVCAEAQAMVLEQDGEPEAALNVLESSLTTLNRSPLILTDTTAALLSHIANLHHQAGRIDETLAVNALALETLREDGRENSLGYVVASFNQAALLQSVGELRRAQQLREDTIESLTALDDRGAAPAWLWPPYAMALNQFGQYDSALELLTKHRARAEGKDEEALAQFDFALGTTYSYLGNVVQAHLYLDTAEAFFSRAAGQSRLLLMGVNVSRVRTYLAEGRTDDAKRLSDSLLAAADYPSDLSLRVPHFLLVQAAQIAIATGKAAEAETFATDALQVATRAARVPTESAYVGRALLARARARILLEKPVEAAADLRAAIPSLDNGLGADHADAVQARALLEDFPR